MNYIQIKLSYDVHHPKVLRIVQLGSLDVLHHLPVPSSNKQERRTYVHSDNDDLSRLLTNLFEPTNHILLIHTNTGIFLNTTDDIAVEFRHLLLLIHTYLMLPRNRPSFHKSQIF